MTCGTALIVYAAAAWAPALHRSPLRVAPRVAPRAAPVRSAVSLPAGSGDAAVPRADAACLQPWLHQLVPAEVGPRGWWSTRHRGALAELH